MQRSIFRKHHLTSPVSTEQVAAEEARAVLADSGSVEAEEDAEDVPVPGSELDQLAGVAPRRDPAQRVDEAGHPGAVGGLAVNAPR